MRKKILYLQPHFDQERPRDIRTANMIKHISAMADVYVVCFKSAQTSRPNEGYHIHRIAFSLFSAYVLHKELTACQMPAPLSYLVSGLRFLLKRLIFPDIWILQGATIQKEAQKAFPEDPSFDYIVASMMPFSMGKIAWQFQQKYHPQAQLIFDIGDPLSNNSVPSPFSNLRRLKWEQKYLPKAKYIVLTNTDTLNYYTKILKLPPDRFRLIPQGVDTQLFKPANKMKQYEHGEKIKLVYAGLFYKNLRDPSLFLKAIADVDHITVDIYAAVHHARAANITYYPRKSQTELLAAFHAATALLYFDNAYGMQTSGKIYELLALQKPIVFVYSNPESAVLLACRHYPNVILVRNEEGAIRQILQSLLADLQNIPPPNYAVSDFSWQQRAAAFQSLFA